MVISDYKGNSKYLDSGGAAHPWVNGMVGQSYDLSY